MTIILIILVAWFLIVGIATNFGEKGNYRPPKEKWSDRYDGPVLSGCNRRTMMMTKHLSFFIG